MGYVVEILARSPLDFHFAIGFFAKWTQGMDFTSLGGGLMVTIRFPWLLPKFSPHVEEIGRYMGYVVGDRVVPSTVYFSPDHSQGRNSPACVLFWPLLCLWQEKSCCH